MLASFTGERRRLHDRWPAAAGLIVDDDGASLGPRYPLVERRDGGCAVINSDEAGLLLRTVFDYYDDPAPFVGLCRSIATALDAGNLPRAQLLGLQMPMGGLGPHHLRRLDLLAAMAKAGYDPSQPRNADGEWGGGATATSATPVAVAAMATTGTANASAELLAEGAAVASEAAGAGASALVAPILLAGGLLIPSSNSNVHEGSAIGHPDLAYRYDEGILTLFCAELDGRRTVVFHGFPQDGTYRDETGQLIGRVLPEGFDLAPEFLNAMSVPSAQTRSKTDARVAANDRPEICPDPSPALEFMSPRAAAYQTQITGLPPGLVVRLNGVKYDGCNAANGNMEDAKAEGLEKFMVDSGHWRDWFRGAKSIEDQMKRQSEKSNGRHVDWYFAERQVADYFRDAATRLELPNVSVYYVPAAAP